MTIAHDTLPLKPCPCCGARAAIQQKDAWYWVECTRCFLATQYRISASGDAGAIAAESWNRRVNESTQEALPL